MHNILVNALGVTNHSGRAVLIAHLDQLLETIGGQCQLHVLVSSAEKELRRHFGKRVVWRVAPAMTSSWFVRTAWECLRLSHEAKACHADLYFTPSGIATIGLSTPQVVYCMNPWALVRAARRRRDAVKAWFQRIVYRRTVRRAAALVYLSRFMQRAYRQNAGQVGRREIIAYQPVPQADDANTATKDPGRIVCVSAMAPHKNIETVLMAFKKISKLPNVKLYLVGAWPDKAYANRIRKLIKRLVLDKQVFIEGHVSREALVMHYAKAKVFCLMSRCESFGIPAVEAQAYGTPVVCSNVCAVPEICGKGGLFYGPDDVKSIADALELMLTDDDEWQRFSALARENAATYNNNCSQPLASLFIEMLNPIQHMAF